MRRFAAILCVGLVVLSSACSQGEDEARPERIPCGRARAGGEHKDGVRRLGRFVFDEADVTSLSLWGSRLAYVRDGAAAVVCDLDSGRPRVVGRARAGRTIEWLRGDGEIVVWVEADVDDAKSTPGSDPLGPPMTGRPWAIHAYDLRRGRGHVIATGGPRDGYWTEPEPEVEWPWVVWLDLPISGNLETDGPVLVSHSLRDGTRRVLSARNFPLESGITDGRVYFDARTDAGRDLHVVPPDASTPPERLTENGTITEPVVGNGWVTWASLPRTRDLEVPLGDLPLAALRAGSRAPIEAGRGKWAVPDDGFLLVYSVEQATALFVRRIGTTDAGIELAGQEFDLGSGVSVDGDRIAWVTFDDPYGLQRPSYLNIARIERSH